MNPYKHESVLLFLGHARYWRSSDLCEELEQVIVPEVSWVLVQAAYMKYHEIMWNSFCGVTLSFELLCTLKVTFLHPFLLAPQSLPLDCIESDFGSITREREQVRSDLASGERAPVSGVSSTWCQRHWPSKCQRHWQFINQRNCLCTLPGLLGPLCTDWWF